LPSPQWVQKSWATEGAARDATRRREIEALRMGSP
jgi:hypothetical protein